MASRSKHGRWLFAACFALTLPLLMVQSAAALPCDDVTVSTQVRLINGRASTLGPFTVTLAAGDYRVIMTSADAMHAPGYQPSQTGEQWYFTTDSGYRSPTTPDLAEGSGAATFDMGIVTLPETTSVTFHHASTVPGANSVVPGVVFESQIPPCGPTTTTQTSTTQTSTTQTSTTQGQTSTSLSTSTSTAISTPGSVLPSSTVKSSVVSVPTTNVVPQVDGGDNPGTLPRTGGELTYAVVGAAMVLVGLVLTAAVRATATPASK